MAEKKLDRRDSDVDRDDNKVFGNIDPDPATRDHLPGSGSGSEDEDIESMSSGSRNEEPIPGARDVTGRGGVAPETGGTRNLRRSTGATGGDVGNRPE
jgi:hypothetical protein